MNEKTRLMHLRTTHAKMRPRTTPQPRSTVAGYRSRQTKSPLRRPDNTQSPTRRSRRLSPLPTDDKSVAQPRSSVTGNRPRQTKSPSRRPVNTQSPTRRLDKSGSTLLEQQKREGLSTHNILPPEKATKRTPLVPPIEVNETGPFGYLLAETPTEKRKENSYF